MQCKDIPEKPILEFLNEHPWPEARMATWCGQRRRREGDGNDVSAVMPAGTPTKLVLAKMKMMKRRGVVEGCACGCRGDFRISDKGLRELTPLEPV